MARYRSRGRKVGLRLLSGLFALFAAAELIQLIQAAQGEHPDPPGLILTHAVTGVLAGLAAFGLWQARSWAPLPVLGWGVVMAAMLMVLGPVLDEPRETWRGLRVVGALVAVFACGSQLVRPAPYAVAGLARSQYWRLGG